MAYQFKNDDEMFEATKEIAHTLANLRFWTREWKSKYGSQRRWAMLRWEEKADEVLEKYGLEYQPQIKPEQLKKP